MKCLLCKGKGSLLVHKTCNPDDSFRDKTFFEIWGDDYYEHEVCPRCKGKGYEKVIGKLDKRACETFKTYSEHYSKYFKEEEIPQHHEEILKKL